MSEEQDIRKNLTIALSNIEKATLDALAKKSGLKRSQYLRKVILDALENRMAYQFKPEPIEESELNDIITSL